MWFFVIHINETEPYTGVMDGKGKLYYTMNPSRGSLPLKHPFIATDIIIHTQKPIITVL
jgi:hypothetical protein